MDTAKDIAEQSSLLCVAAVGALSGGAPAFATCLAPLAVLTAIGLTLRNGCAARACSTATDAARKALKASPDFSPDHHDRAAELLSQARRPVSLSPDDLRTASRSDGFNERLADMLLDPVDFQPDDDAPRRILHLSLTTAIATCRKDAELHRQLTQELLLQAARDAGAQITLLERIDDTTQEILSLVRELRETKATTVPEDTLLALARKIRPTVRDKDEALRELDAAADLAAEAIQRGEQGSNLEPFVDEILHRLAQMTEAGDLSGAANAAEDALAQARAGLAQLREQAIRQHMLNRDAAAAARLIVERVTEDAPEDPFAALRAEQDIWYERGRDKGVRLDAEIAIAIARATLTRAATDDQRGTALNDLGIALQTLGQREAGTTRLEEAVTAYRAALEFRTREAVPLGWAMSTGNQSVALMYLADRSNDLEMIATAKQQIAEAEAVMRSGGHIPFADYYAAQLLKADEVARAIADRSA